MCIRDRGKGSTSKAIRPNRRARKGCDSPYQSAQRAHRVTRRYEHSSKALRPTVAEAKRWCLLAADRIREVRLVPALLTLAGGARGVRWRDDPFGPPDVRESDAPDGGGAVAPAEADLPLSPPTLCAARLCDSGAKRRAHER